MAVAPNRFASPAGDASPLSRFGAVTPSDVADTQLPEVSRALYIGVAGHVTFTPAEGADVTLSNLPVGWHPLRVRQVKATGTSATNMVWGA